VPWLHVYGAQAVRPASPLAAAFCDVWSSTHLAPVGTQVPALQAKPIAQSAAVAHLVPHASPLHANGLQDLAICTTHMPAPLHTLGVSSPAVHVEAHVVEAPGYEQAAGSVLHVPAHMPVPPQAVRGL
jgi:hypothetical protein